jgi:hypothetical protein
MITTTDTATPTRGVDPSISTFERAILAIKWSSFVGLFVNVLV